MTWHLLGTLYNMTEFLIYFLTSYIPHSMLRHVGYQKWWSLSHWSRAGWHLGTLYNMTEFSIRVLTSYIPHSMLRHIGYQKWRSSHWSRAGEARSGRSSKGQCPVRGGEWESEWERGRKEGRERERVCVWEKVIGLMIEGTVSWDRKSECERERQKEGERERVCERSNVIGTMIKVIMSWVCVCNREWAEEREERRDRDILGEEACVRKETERARACIHLTDTMCANDLQRERDID